jgi:hypothetical protein
MGHVIFENPGEIDPLLIKTFGVSVKEGDNPIGFFGTGLKYALAILLRTGHEVSIQAGERVLAFGRQEAILRNQPFNLITMDGDPLGFTDAVGKTWEVWMAYRELHCNCKDEGGTIYAAEELPAPTAGVTRVIVSGDEFRTQYEHREVFILEGEPFLKLDGVNVHKGESRGIFYRGMLVHRFPKTQVSRFTYDITRHVDLTEDRTAKYACFLPMYLAASILGAEHDAFLRELLVLSDSKYYENEFDFRDAGVWGVAKPTATFLKTVEHLSRDRAARTNATAVARFKEVKRAELTPDTTVLRGVESEILERAVAFCKKVLNFEVDAYPLIVTDTLGMGVLGMAEGGRIYISRHAIMQGTKRVAGTLVEEFIHLKHGYSDESRELQDFLLDRLVSLGEEMRGEPL